MQDHLKSRISIIHDQKVHSYEHLGNSSLPTLIFLHGWRSESRAWFPALQQFINEGYNIYLIDLPGFGKSENPRSPFTVSDYASIVEGIIEKFNLAHIVLIGHSVGGRIGIKYAATHPPVLEKLILINSAGVRLAPREVSFKNKVAKIAKPFFKPSFMQPLRKKIYEHMGAQDYLERPELKETLVNIINEDLEPYLSKILCPTLLVWGEKDIETPLEAAYRMERLIQNSTLTVFEKAGHFSFLDEPEAFSQEVITFIKNEPI